MDVSSGDSASDAGHDQDALFAGAVTNHATERVERFGHQHRRGFYRAFSQLQLLRELRLETVESPTATIFADEQACESYLIGRLQASPPPCPRCAKSKHHFLPCRRRYECAGCGAQFGLRSGTVMERSPLPLAAWFAAIQSVCTNTRIAVREVSEQTGIKRLPTVRLMMRKIRLAVESENAERLLAGLHAFDRDSAAPAAGAAKIKNKSKLETSSSPGPRKFKSKPR
jgi:transposase-like protein